MNEKDVTIYLSGIMDEANQEEKVGWRQYVIANWQGECLDPCRRDLDPYLEENIAKIVESDLDDIFESDIILVNFYRPSVGTAQEIVHAWYGGKTIVLVNSSGKENISPWLLWHVDYHCDTVDDALLYIRNLIATIDEEN